MQEVILRRLHRLIDEYDDLARELPESALSMKAPGRSNTIGQQLWCVIGGHESAVRAIEKGEWAGFDCSLTETTDKQKVVETLSSSADALRGALAGDSPVAGQMGLFVLEHDAMHQGQLIRFVYSLDLQFPQSWIDHWHLKA